ncbi:MAG: cytochrome C [Acidobacteria bacterium]|nr:MAG: cytochrome C [Acidobacteriota bacterium]
MKRIRARYVVLLIILIGLAATGWYVMARGFSARTQPTSAEAFIARRLRGIAIPRGAREAQNPVAASPEVLSEAMAHFADHCATCHANDGSGETSIGQGLYPKPPDMRQSDTQRLTDGELYYIIHNGVRFTGMPAFGDGSKEGLDEDSWKLVHFIRHLPMITAEELAQMQQMNPKSPAELKEEEEIERFLQGGDEPSTHKHH